jgi:hypothetical protein
MARLTILQASQQGFGSTLTIHRHIKEGSLPVYEEGDVKLLEVDDLITLLGEPEGAVFADEQTAAAVDNIDIYEYNRMKSELDQKNKKNMWLAADLAEVVRELKEKEAKFEAERTRLLKVLEQAQALLLREAKRAGGGATNDQLVTSKPGAPATNGDAGNAANEEAPATPEFASSNSESGNSDVERSPISGLSHEKLPFSDDEHGGAAAAFNDAPTDSNSTAPNIVIDDETRPKKRSKSRNGVNPVNPLVPPMEDSDDKPPKSRLMSTTGWLILVTLVGSGLVVFEFRTQIVSSVEHIMKTLG